MRHVTATMRDTGEVLSGYVTSDDGANLLILQEVNDPPQTDEDGNPVAPPVHILPLADIHHLEPVEDAPPPAGV